MRKGKDRVTIREVAAMAGVSIGTVSRVINNSGYVSERTRKQVLKALQETGFRPNITAQSMIRKSSSIIGIAVPEINNPYIANLVVLIETILNRQGLSIMLCNTRYSQKKLSEFIQQLIARNAEGLIFIGLDSNDEYMIHEVERFIPAVCANSRVGDFDSVNVTDWQSAFDMTEHLISAGHRRIAFMGHNKYSSPTMSRLRGFEDALQKYGIPREERWILPAKTESSPLAMAGTDVARELLSGEELPTAVFAVNDFYAVSCYAAAVERGLQVGRDLSVVGFDDVYLARLINPPLTTVNYDIQLVADTVTNLLMQRKREGSDACRQILIPGTIVRRESVCSL